MENRFERQVKLIGEESQKKLKSIDLAIVGVGALGSLISELAVRSGVGNLTLIDFDKVALSNLHRQFLYNEQDIGKFKVDVAKKRLNKIN